LRRRAPGRGKRAGSALRRSWGRVTRHNGLRAGSSVRSLRIFARYRSAPVTPYTLGRRQAVTTLSHASRTSHPAATPAIQRTTPSASRITPPIRPAGRSARALASSSPPTLRSAPGSNARAFASSSPAGDSGTRCTGPCTDAGTHLRCTSSCVPPVLPVRGHQRRAWDLLPNRRHLPIRLEREH